MHSPSDKNSEALRQLAALLRERHEFRDMPGPGEGMVSDEETWAEQEEWRKGYDALHRRIMDALTPIEAGDTPVSSIGTSEEAVQVLEQALAEMNHSHTNPEWFTKGESGAAAQFRLWHGKGVEAIRVLRTTPSARVPLSAFESELVQIGWGNIGTHSGQRYLRESRNMTEGRSGYCKDPIYYVETFSRADDTTEKP